MSVQRSGSWFSQSRVDVRDLKSIDSSVQADFDSLLAGFATNLFQDPNNINSGIANPYVLRGFEIATTGSISAQASSLTMLVANSGIFVGSSLTAGTFYLTDWNASPQALDGNVNPTYVKGSFAANTANYVSIDYTRQLDNSTVDIVYFWDVASDSQFSQVVPLARTLNYVINITTTAFDDPSQSTVCPIAVVNTDANGFVVSIEDARPLMFALGRGSNNQGQTPDLSYDYPWSQGRTPLGPTETANSTNVFSGGDKSIGSLKELIDALETEIKAIKGTAYWSSPVSGGGGGGSIVHLREDALNTVVTGSGSVFHDASIAGKMNWDQDIILKVIGTELTYKILAYPSPGGAITLTDDEVAYISLVRDIPTGKLPPFPGSGSQVNLIWTNGSTAVTSVSSATWTTNLLPGDMIRLASADDSLYYTIASITNGHAVVLTQTYGGATSPATGDPSVYAYGTYQVGGRATSQIQISPRATAPFSDSTYWLFLRADDSGVPKVYAHFFGSELLMGQSDEVGEGISNENLRYIGAANAASSAPQYAALTETGPTVGNNFVGDGNSLTKGIKVLDIEADAPLRPHANVGTPDQHLYFQASTVLGGDGTSKTVAPLDGSVFYNLPALYIDFSTAQPTGSTPADFNIDTIAPVDSSIYIAALSLESDGKIAVSFSGANPTVTPALIGSLFPPSNTPIGYVTLEFFTATNWRTLGSSTAVIENAEIVRFGNGSGGSAQSSSEYNDDLISMFFQGKITDEFTEAPTNPLTTVDNTLTNAVYNAGSQNYTLSFDGSQTVSGNTTTYTLSAPAVYTSGVPAIGDVLVIGNQARTITGIAGAVLTVDATFGVIAGGTACCVSQSVDSLELYHLSLDGDSLATTFSDQAFGEVMIDYEDAPSGDIFDIAAPAFIAFSANGTVTYPAAVDPTKWSNVQIRPQYQYDAAQTTGLWSSSLTSLYVRFFANQIGNAAGTVNLLRYRAYMLPATPSTYSNVNSAYGFTDSSQTPVNMSISVVGGKTQIVLGWQYPVNVNPTTVYGSLDVYLNGQLIPRYLAGSTPGAYYTETNSTTILLDQDYSAFNLDVEVIQRVTVIDTSTQNTNDIATLNTEVINLNTEITTINSTAGAAFVGASTAGHNYISGANVQAQLDSVDATFTQLYTTPTVSLVTLGSHTGHFPASGSGTYTTPAGVKYLRVVMVGNGGGGGGSSQNGGSGSGGGSGNNVTFGANTAGGGGGGGANGGAGGIGGTPTVGIGSGVAFSGGFGSGGSGSNSGVQFPSGGGGAPSPFGGAGGGGGFNLAGDTATSGSGSGGGGGGCNTASNTWCGSGGGAGAYIDVMITPTPLQTFSYATGSPGSGGTAGTLGHSGGGGGGGQIIVYEYYN